jgi:hypothetical protein
MDTIFMKIRTFCALALGLTGTAALAEPIYVQATFTAESSIGEDISGYASGTLDGNIMEVTGPIIVIGTEPDYEGFAETGDWSFNFGDNTGSVIFTSCRPIPGVPDDCADAVNYPDGPIVWDTVSGDPSGFTTTIYVEDDEGEDEPETITFDWRVEEITDVQTTLNLEEPVNGAAHSGIGNLRGWGFNPLGLERIDIYIDGSFAFTAPSGGYRPDVGAAYPDLIGSENSGFSLAYGYSNLSIGQHTVTARAVDRNGDFVERSSTFQVEAFDKKFISSSETVDISEATVAYGDDEITIEGAQISDKQYDLLLKWRTAEQGFEIIEIE